MHSSRMRTVRSIPACAGQKGVYPSMYWAGGECIPACTEADPPGQNDKLCLRTVKSMISRTQIPDDSDGNTF